MRINRRHDEPAAPASHGEPARYGGGQDREYAAGDAPLDLFSYAALSREDEAAARSDAALIKAHMRSAAESIIEVGLALKRQKERLPHGTFLPWIATEFGMSADTANRMMLVAATYAEKSRIVRDLGPTALYELAAPSTPPEVRDQVEALVIDGQKVTAADVKRLKAETKAAQDNAADTANRPMYSLYTYNETHRAHHLMTCGSGA